MVCHSVAHWLTPNPNTRIIASEMIQMVLRSLLNFIKPASNGQHIAHASEPHLLDVKIDRTELRDRYKTYLVAHYLSCHITVVSVVLAIAGVAAASLITRPMGADHQLLVLWLLWVGSLVATGVAYGGPMVGAFALPSSIPSVSDLLLPILVGIIEFLLFTVLVRQVTPVGLNALVNTWLAIMALFGTFAGLSVLRARHHYTAGMRQNVYSDDVHGMIERYLQCLTRDASGAAATTTLAATGAGLRISGIIGGPLFVFPLAITFLLLLGLRGHSDTAKMWRDLLPHEANNQVRTSMHSPSHSRRGYNSAIMQNSSIPQLPSVERSDEQAPDSSAEPAD
jgi:hypothetical protein